MTTPLLAAVLDGRIVVLDVPRARIILLDSRSERIWRACTRRTETEIAAHLGEPRAEVAPTLQHLLEGGLILRRQGRLEQALMTWL